MIEYLSAAKVQISPEEMLDKSPELIIEVVQQSTVERRVEREHGR
jgi:hypothetical protein